MTDHDQKQLGKILWKIADDLRGMMDADDFRDYMLSFLFLRYLSDNYEAAAKKELGREYPSVPDGDRRTPLAMLYAQNPQDIKEFEKLMRRKVHYVIEPAYLWTHIAELARTQDSKLLDTLQKASNILKRNPFRMRFKAFFRKSTSRPASSGAPTLRAMKNCVRLSPRSPTA